MTRNVDVLIVGASLAGSSLALRLSRAGVETLLVDKMNFPRPKACGEGLSGAGVGVFNELGLGAQLRALPHSPYYGYRIHRRSASQDLDFSGPDGSPHLGLGAQRYLLDDMLAKTAQRESAFARFGSAVRRIEREKDFYAVSVGNERWRAKYVVLADGARSVLAQKLGLLREQRRVLRFGMSAQLYFDEDVTCGRVHVIVGNNYEICLTPLPNKQATLTAFGPKNFSQAFRDQEFRASIIRKIEESVGADIAHVDEFHLEGHVGQGRRMNFEGGVLAVGDCAEQLDPIGGMGMTHALLSARIAAEAFSRIRDNGESAQSSFLRYAQERELLTRRLRGFTRLSYFLLVKQKDTRMARALERSRLSPAVSALVHGAAPTSRALSGLACLVLQVAGL